MTTRPAGRLLRIFGLNRRAHGSNFRWVDKISDARQEFSYSAQRLVISWILTFLALHYFGCIIWLTVRLQHFPEGGSCACFVKALGLIF